jgi:hypothetical protein
MDADVKGKSGNSIDSTKAVDETIVAADKEARMELAVHPARDELGFCHIFWWTKKRILKEKYGVDWKTPAEEKPGVMFD